MSSQIDCIILFFAFLNVFFSWFKFTSFSFQFVVQSLADIIPRDALLWKLKLLKSAAAYANSRLHAVKAEVLVLARFSHLAFFCLASVDNYLKGVSLWNSSFNSWFYLKS